MCGIVSLIYKDEATGMGQEATELLKRLEYRGYDSTGASFIDKDKTIVLVKKVGAPSRVTRELDIPSFRGQRFIGQVRWATYGSVTDTNSQPHLVRCKVELVGAHNGNISNTDSLKASLSARGHKVLSDNDGEMIVHLVEEHYAANLAAPAAALAELRKAWDQSGLADTPPDKVFLMLDSIRKAEAEAEGSYAAAVADPQVPGVFAIKSGSSLYAGMGRDAQGDFVVVSSDLSSVLSKTSMLIPLHEGEGIWYTENRYLIFKLKGEPAFTAPALKRSKLNVRDTALDPRYGYYMEQEIFSAPDTMEEIIRYYFADPAEAALALVFDEKAELVRDLLDQTAALASHTDVANLAAGAAALCDSVDFKLLSSRIKADPGAYKNLGAHKSLGAHKTTGAHTAYRSDEAQLLAEILGAAPNLADSLALLDMAFIWKKRRSVMHYAHELIGRMHDAREAGGAIYLIASGTSYHAALTGAYFFSGLARLAVYPCNPGLFRSAYMDCLKPEDFVLAISQSGETKDLVDILQDIQERYPTVGRVSLVNNENSRIPQELSDFYLPLLCGPEIAVAATKSFVSQLSVLYILAARAALPEAQVLARLRQAQALISATLKQSAPALDKVAADIFLRPSLHILGSGSVGLAKEGALKIREVVLNHAEGYDTAEFKHGPNTILGKNTIFSIPEVEKAVDAALALTNRGTSRNHNTVTHVLRGEPAILEGLFSDYPLIFVCPPDERDRRIAISQIHTHKIRGAEIILIAEKNPELELAVEGIPEGSKTYRHFCVELPPTDTGASGSTGQADRNIFVFAATAALQYLAFRMSVLKMEYLDRLGIADHGVHPDAPKNVSKSITVD